jgi:hypothetical protein
VTDVDIGTVYRPCRPRVEHVQVNIGAGPGNGLQVRPHDVLAVIANAIEKPCLPGRLRGDDAVQHAKQMPAFIRSSASAMARMSAWQCGQGTKKRR